MEGLLWPCAWKMMFLKFWRNCPMTELKPCQHLTHCCRFASLESNHYTLWCQNFVYNRIGSVRHFVPTILTWGKYRTVNRVGQFWRKLLVGKRFTVLEASPSSNAGCIEGGDATHCFIGAWILSRLLSFTLLLPTSSHHHWGDDAISSRPSLPFLSEVLLRYLNSVEIETSPTHAMFYSVNSPISSLGILISKTAASTSFDFNTILCDTGGLDLAPRLIKAVSHELLQKHPSIQVLSTLSPIPGFLKWLQRTQSEVFCFVFCFWKGRTLKGFRSQPSNLERVLKDMPAIYRASLLLLSNAATERGALEWVAGVTGHPAPTWSHSATLSNALREPVRTFLVSSSSWSSCCCWPSLLFLRFLLSVSLSRSAYVALLLLPCCRKAAYKGGQSGTTPGCVIMLSIESCARNNEIMTPVPAAMLVSSCAHMRLHLHAPLKHVALVKRDCWPDPSRPHRLFAPQIQWRASTSAMGPASSAWPGWAMSRARVSPPPRAWWSTMFTRPTSRARHRLSHWARAMARVTTGIGGRRNSSSNLYPTARTPLLTPAYFSLVDKCSTHWALTSRSITKSWQTLQKAMNESQFIGFDYMLQSRVNLSLDCCARALFHVHAQKHT